MPATHAQEPPGPASARRAVTFFVQAGARVGMGHLSRSLALSRMLERMGLDVYFQLDGDEAGRREAASRGVRLSRSAPDSACAAIIDAVTLSEATASRIAAFPKRLLISPVCDRADLATHVLVREASPELRQALSATAQLILDPAFAFVTAEGLTPSPRDYQTLAPGLCLSGGEDRFALDDLLSAILAVDAVTQVRLLDHRTPPASPPGRPPIVHAPQSPEPWAFLSPANLFIGGEGVMIAEAVAQGLPAISLCRPGYEFKNRSLIDAGCVEPVSRDRSGIARIAELLSNRRRLADMHRAALKIAPAGSETTIAQRIADILSL